MNDPNPINKITIRNPQGGAWSGRFSFEIDGQRLYRVIDYDIETTLERRGLSKITVSFYAREIELKHGEDK